MRQADTVLKQDGELWYSKEYIKQQIEMAYESGLAAGASIRFYAIDPMTTNQAVDYAAEFFRIVNERYSEMYQNGRVIKPKP